MPRSRPVSSFFTDAGLCQTCAHARVVTSAKGSHFLRCAAADVPAAAQLAKAQLGETQLGETQLGEASAEHAPRPPRYPRLPVRHCGSVRRTS